MPSKNPPSENPFTGDAAFKDGAAFIDGKYMPIDQARIPITDWGFLRSDVTYDAVHVWRGSFFRLEDHLARFERSVAALRMDTGHGLEATKEILHECVRLSGLRDALVEMGCTRGTGPPGSRDPREFTNRFFAFAVPFVWIAKPEKQLDGLHLVISTVRRIPPESVDPKVKNFHWGDLIRGLYDAYERGGETAVLVDEAGNVTEGPGFNVFMVKDGRVSTPARGILEGITRRTVIELCAEAGIPLEETLVHADAVRGADEVFLSSTAGGILPVTTVDGKTMGDGKPGPLTTHLRELYWSKKEAGWHGTPVDYR